MAKLYNLARVSTATTGTGTITLGSPVEGYLSFADAGVANGETVAYGIKDGANSETGTGVYTSAGTTLTRSVTKSTNAGSPINLSGTAQVFITARKEDILNPENNLSDLASAATARTNLGLAAIAASGSASDLGAGTVPAARMPALTGDVTTSAGAVATTIANDAVTYAKMQNISATSRILGRKTAAAGDTEECTLSEILDFIGSAAQGDILYRGASGWARLGAGTSGQFLKTNGGSADPAWAAAGDFVLLTSGTISNSATSLDLVLTSYTSYRALKFFGNGWRPATDGVGLYTRFSTNGGSSYDAAATDYGYVATAWNDSSPPSQAGSASSTTKTSFIAVTPNSSNLVGSASDEGVHFELTLFDQANTSYKTRMEAHGCFINSTANVSTCLFNSAGHRVTAQDTDAIRFLWSSGNFASSSPGTYAIFGLK